MSSLTKLPLVLLIVVGNPILILLIVARLVKVTAAGAQHLTSNALDLQSIFLRSKLSDVSVNLTFRN